MVVRPDCLLDQVIDYPFVPANGPLDLDRQRASIRALACQH
jgi:hypothetical protein